MQGKGIIKALFAVLLLVTVYQLILWIPTYRAEKTAENYCNGIASEAYPYGQCQSDYLDSISDQVVFRIPLIKTFTYSDLKASQMGLGLDLKGGMSATLQVDLKEYLRKQAEKRPGEDPLFDKALEEAQKQLASVQQDYLTLFGAEWDKIANGRKLGDVFSFSSAYKGKITLNSSTQEVVNILREDTRGVVKDTYNMLLQRIDRLGVIQPNITLDENRDLILVELPGIENPKRATNILESTAELEFWDTYNVSDVYRGFIDADKLLSKTMADTSGVVDAGNQATERDSLDADGNVVTDSSGNVIKIPVEGVAATPTDGLGPLLSKFTPIQGNGGAIVGEANKYDRETISKMLAREEVQRFFPSDIGFMWDRKAKADENKKPTQNYYLYAIKKGYEGEAPLKGDIIGSAGTETDPQTGQIGVNLTMRGDGPSIWADMTTKAAAANNKPVAISLDGEIVSAPSVNEPITGGRTRITGGFTMQEAGDLAKILEIGALPAKPRIIQQSQVGPTLGKENIRRSVTSLVVGFVLVLLFMVAYYGGGGVASIIALLANIVFIFAALSNMGNVLTLPGIAGIILTIGMAVDANVIIFERIREELRNEKSLLLAIEDGFRHSYSAIIDANVTTLLTAGVLFYFGMGPIKGFATILGVGVILSVITAVLLGRLIIDWWTVGKKKPMNFSMGWSEKVLSNLQVDWLGKRKMAYSISGIIIVLGIVSMFVRGFDLGVDFTGGYSYVVEFTENQDVSTVSIKEALKGPFKSEPIVKAVDGTNRYSITTKYLVGDNSEGVADKVASALYEGVNSIAGGSLDQEVFLNPEGAGTHVTSSNIVGPTIADDIRSSSRWATIAALILIFGYIFLRFRKWQFSLGAVAALFHDVLITLSVFSLLWGFAPWSMEIDQAFIAALLTVVGYSINDTVVVFDRIREYMGAYSSKSKEEIINAAVSSTVSRTVITSVTTLFVVLMLFIFGGGSIKGFAFALLIGVIVGTYSSIFIATPVMSDTSKDLKAKEKKKKKSSFAHKNQPQV